MEALQRGVPLQCAGGGAQLERALQDALPRWNDDRWIATSPLALRLRPWGAGSGHMDPEAVRKTIREALDRARREAPADLQAAFQALDLSYLVPDRGSHEQVARRLGVSRSTFYRLLRRAVHLLAEELRREDGGGTAAE
jgi:DNA-directed RNA polymerase specialized sigma24 family protein